MLSGSRYSDFDILELAGEYYGRISVVWRRAFWIALFINCIVFASMIVDPPLGNHDWTRIPWSGFWDELKRGRWFAPAILSIVGHVQVPVLNHVAAMILGVASGISATTLWKKDRSISTVVFLVCIVTLAPYVLFQHYYRWSALMYPAAALLGILGLNAASRSSPKAILGASVVITLSIATYQPVVNVLATVLCFCLLFEVAEGPGGVAAISTRVKDKHLPRIVALIVGSASYALSVYVLKKTGTVGDATQLKTISTPEILGRIEMVVRASFEQLVVSQAFMPSAVKVPLLAIIVGSFIAVAYKAVSFGGSVSMRFLRALTCVSLLVLALISTKVVFALSASEGIQGLKWGYATAFFYMGCAAMLLSCSSRLLRSVTLVVLMLVLALFAREDLVFQELMSRSNQHDLAYANRLLYRMESIPGVDVNKQYKYLQVGDYPDFRRQRYARGQRYDLEPGNQFFSSMSPLLRPARVFPFLGSKLSMQTVVKGKEGYWDGVKKAIDHAEGSRPWPHASSVALVEDLVVVYLDESALAQLRDEYERHLQTVHE